MTAFIREYNVATTIYFPLIKVGVNNFAVGADYTHASGDVKISKDGAAAATATNAPSAITMGNGAMWKLDLTATEMQAKTIVITVIDATTKAVEDQMIVVETYGAGNGELDINDWVNQLLKFDISGITGEARRSVLNALRLLLNKWSVSAGTLTVTKEDDTTSAYTVALTGTAGADPITASDPT
jgi:hypothetical protein